MTINIIYKIYIKKIRNRTNNYKWILLIKYNIKTKIIKIH